MSALPSFFPLADMIGQTAAYFGNRNDCLWTISDIEEKDYGEFSPPDDPDRIFLIAFLPSSRPHRRSMPKKMDGSLARCRLIWEVSNNQVTVLRIDGAENRRLRRFLVCGHILTVMLSLPDILSFAM